MANSTASSWLCRLHIATITVILRTGTATARPAAPNTAHPKITRSGSNIKAIPAISASLQPQTLISEDLLHSTSTANANPKPKSGTVLKVDLNLGRYGTGVDRLGFEPRTSCLQSRRSSADLPAPTRAQRRGADETFRDNSPVQRGSTLILSAQMTEPWVLARTRWYAGSSG